MNPNNHQVAGVHGEMPRRLPSLGHPSISSEGLGKTNLPSDDHKADVKNGRDTPHSVDTVLSSAPTDEGYSTAKHADVGVGFINSNLQYGSFVAADQKQNVFQLQNDSNTNDRQWFPQQNAKGSKRMSAEKGLKKEREAVYKAETPSPLPTSSRSITPDKAPHTPIKYRVSDIDHILKMQGSSTPTSFDVHLNLEAAPVSVVQSEFLGKALQSSQSPTTKNEDATRHRNTKAAIGNKSLEKPVEQTAINHNKNIHLITDSQHRESSHNEQPNR